VTTEWIQEIEQRREQLPRRIKIRKYFIYSPHPSLLPEGEGAKLLNLTALPPKGVYGYGQTNDKLLTPFMVYSILMVELVERSPERSRRA
jgi:hypothetical protein